MTSTHELRIYAASLSDYNSGILHGVWIDVTDDESEMQEQIAAMLRGSKYPNVMVEDPDTGEKVPSAEEWAIHDHEGFGPLDIGENPGLDDLAELARCVEQHGPAFLAYVDHMGDWTDESGFEDAYNGEWDSEQDFAENFAEDIGAIPQDNSWPCYCIDWERATRELMMDYFSVDCPTGGVYIFRLC